MRSVRFAIALGILGLPTLGPGLTSATPFRFKVDLIYNAAGARAVDINNRGDVIGNAGDCGFDCCATGDPILWVDSTFVFVPFGGVTYAINDSGDVVGSDYCHTDPYGVRTWRGFLYRNGVFFDLGVCENNNFGTDAYGVADIDIVVGVCFGGPTQPVYRVAGWWTVLPTGGYDGEAYDINNAGWIVGAGGDEQRGNGQSRWRPYRWINGVERPLQCPVGDCYGPPILSGHAAAINEQGFAAGWWGEAMVWDSLGVATSLGPGYAWDINECNWVIGERPGDLPTLWLPDAVGYTAYDINELISDTTWTGTITEIGGLNDRGMIAATSTFDLYSDAIVVLTPDSTDADGDALLDLWEICGIYANGDSRVDYVLPDCDPEHKDLYVEIDRIGDQTPAAGVIDSVAAAFGRVPNEELPSPSPDGLPGMTLHVDLDESGLDLAPNGFQAVAGWPPEFDALKDDHFGTLAERADPNWANIRDAKRMAYRYCIWGGQFRSEEGDTVSGVGEIGGNDFLVTLGSDRFGNGGDFEQQTGTFMHELGHTLGLRHGGADDVNYKQNYYSVMNYVWQMPRRYLEEFWGLDYSHDANPELKESHLSEGQGLMGMVPEDLVVPYVHEDTLHIVDYELLGASPVDWNGNGVIDPSPVSVDITYLYSDDDPSPGDTLRGHDDWSAIDLNFRDSSDYADGVHATSASVDEYSTALLAFFNSLPPPDFVHVPAGAMPGAARSQLRVPNPYRPGQRVIFTTGETAMVTLSVYDVAGRLVSTLLGRELPAGRHAVVWSGAGQAASPPGAGVYFVRLRTGDSVLTRKITVVH